MLTEEEIKAGKEITEKELIEKTRYQFCADAVNSSAVVEGNSIISVSAYLFINASNLAGALGSADVSQAQLLR